MSIFREYDIRGIAEQDLTNQRVWSIGRAFAEKLKSIGEKHCYIGMDARVSSPRIASALKQGIEAGEVSCRALGLGPTPLLYFATQMGLVDFPTRSGLMVTGSHNPPEYNGLKMVLGGASFWGKDIQDFSSQVSAFYPEAPVSVPQKEFNSVDIENTYIQFMKKNLARANEDFKVVIDAGNGSAGILAKKTYEALGAKVIPLFCEPDGSFPNHHPDPTVPENLKMLVEAVKKHDANLGIGFDGDGDRIGVVSSTGQILSGDQLLLYFAKDVLKTNPGATIISEVKSSQILYDELEKLGAKAILWKTGHSLIKAKLKESKALLAGEMSGHIFFADRFFGFDDAIYAGARLIEILCKNPEENLDRFLDSLPPIFNTPELRVDCPDDKKFSVVDRFVSLAKDQWPQNVVDIDGARVLFDSGGWGLLRASNTQPVLVMRFEAQSREDLLDIRNQFASALKSIDSKIEVPEL